MSERILMIIYILVTVLMIIVWDRKTLLVIQSTCVCVVRDLGDRTFRAFKRCPMA